MITISIELVAKSENIPKAIDSNVSTNNVASPIKNLFNLEGNGNNLFILGASPLSSGATLSSKEDFYIGSQPADSNGDFAEPYLITVKGDSLKSLIIYFDTVNNQHPRDIIVNEKQYKVDNSIFRLILEETDKIDIIIDNWNVPYYPLRIQTINSFYLKMSQDKILNISRTITDRSDFELPSYGFISNVGALNFVDDDGFILWYIEQGELNQDKRCKIFLNSNKAKQQIGEYYTSEWNYDNNNKEVSVELKDDLEDLQNINTLLQYDFVNVGKRKLRYIYDYLKKVTEGNGYRFAPLDDKTEEVLDTLEVGYAFLQTATLWEQWQKLCQFGLLYMYKNNKNEIVVIYNV